MEIVCSTDSLARLDFQSVDEIDQMISDLYKMKEDWAKTPTKEIMSYGIKLMRVKEGVKS